MYATISPSETQAAAPAHPPLLFQRGSGAGDLAFERRGAKTIAHRAYQSGTVKLRFPKDHHNTSSSLDCVLINLGGGLTGGDCLTLSASLGTESHAVLTTQACEKIYRSLGNAARIENRFFIGPKARLDYLAQPGIFFDQAHLQRSTHIDMANDATYMGLDAMIFGRAAMGEIVQHGTLHDRCYITRGGKLIHAEHFRLSGHLAEQINCPAILGGHTSMATFRYIAPDAESRLDHMRALIEHSSHPAAASAWDGILLLRMAAPSGYALIGALTKIITQFRQSPMPRVWAL